MQPSAFELTPKSRSRRYFGMSRRKILDVGRDSLEMLVFVVFLVLASLAIPRIMHFFNPLSQLPRLGTAAGEFMSGTVAAVAVILYVGVIRVFERRPVAEFAAPSTSIRAIVAGALIGVLLFSTVIATLLIAGDVHVSGKGSFATCFFAFLSAMFGAVFEETIFRGMLFRLVQRHLGTALALLISALVFGLMHAGNPGATFLSSMAIAIEAGVLLGAAYAVTKTLWFPIGLHAGWNFTESGIFGADVSGYKIGGLFHSEFSGPGWLTGGTFGPEAGLPAIIVCMSASLILLKRLRKNMQGTGELSC